MILDRITLTNFRCFEHLELPLDRHLNVFVGTNGAGKSTILQAIAIGLGPILSSLPFEKKAIVPSIQLSDIHLIEEDRVSPAASIYARAEFHEGNLENWEQTKSLLAGNSSASPESDIMAVRRYAEWLTTQHNGGSSYHLPVFAFYGTNRAVNIPIYRLREQALPRFFRRLAGLENALNPSTNFRNSVGWFDVLESREFRQIRDKEIRGVSPELETVRRAISTMIDGIDNPRIDGSTGRFAVDYSAKDGRKIKLYLDQLSDGYQVLLCVVMDFALRLALANPAPNNKTNPTATRDDKTNPMAPTNPAWDDERNSRPSGVSPTDATTSAHETKPSDQSNPLHAEAILIIDEVDLHIHPSWQQSIVPRLRETFPNTQLILTTHSPQVATTVPSQNLRILADSRVYSATPGTEGAEAQRLLEDVFGVSARPPEVAQTAKLLEYLRLVDDRQFDSLRALELRAELDAWSQGSEPRLLEADIQIENLRWEMSP